MTAIITTIMLLQITSMILIVYVFFIEYSKSGIITLENLVIFCVRLLPIVSIISLLLHFCVDILNRNSDVVIYKRKEKK